MPRPSRTLVLSSAALALCAAAASPLEAQLFYGTGAGVPGQAAAFLLAAQNPTTETFDARTLGATVVSFSYAGGGTATIQNGQGVTVGSPYGGSVVSPTQGYTAYPGSGIGNDPQFLFTSPVSAFGFYVSDVELGATLTLAFSGGGTQTANLLGGGDGNLQFIGFVFPTNIITGAVLDIDNGEGITIDNLTVGAISAVPEPSTVALSATGLLALGAIARRRVRA